jgi:hypothetical protein
MTHALSPNEQRWRGIALVLLPGVLLALKFSPPATAGHWLPFAPSCGAITGLPCIFCGTTRALHCLLNGDWPRALYFNWLAFPLLGGAILFLATLLVELLLQRNFLALCPKPVMNRRSAGSLLAGLFLLWVLQVTLAVSQRKTELLNPRGPLYSLVAKP